MPELKQNKQNYYYLDIGKGSKRFYIYISRGLDMRKIRDFLSKQLKLTQSEVEEYSDEGVLRRILGLIDLNSMGSGKNNLKFNLVDRTSFFYFLVLTKALTTVNINRESGEEEVLDVLDINKDSSDDPFYPSFIEKTEVIGSIKYYLKLFIPLNKNYNFSNTFSKTIKTVLSLVKDGSLIQEIKRVSKNNLVKTTTFYKFRINYSIGVIGRVSLYSNIFPIKIHGDYSYSKSYQSFRP